MDFSTLLVGGALTGMVVGSWNKIKEWLTFLVSLAFETIDINDPWIAQCLLDHLLIHHSRSPFYRRVFSHLDAYHLKTGDYTQLMSEVIGKNSILFWIGKVPVIYGRTAKVSRKGNEAPVSGGSSATESNDVMAAQMQFVRGTVNVERLLAAAKKTYYSHTLTQTSRFFIRRCSGGRDGIKPSTNGQSTAEANWKLQPYGVSIHGDWAKSPHLSFCEEERDNYSIHQPPVRDNLKHLYYPQEVVQLIEEMRYWLEMREWHREKRIPWRRGWLLHGPPGTGKTALARAFSQDVDLPLFVFELAEMSNNEFMEAWATMKNWTPCVALFEDFDNVFHGRENVAAKANNPFHMMMGPRRPPRRAVRALGVSDDVKSTRDEEEDEHFFAGRFLTFETVLNAIDGIERCDGVFLVVTTNHLEHIDEALGQPVTAMGIEETTSTRPGRIDRVIHLKEMLSEHKKMMASWILSEFPDVLQEMHRWVDNHPEVLETPAQFQERCSRIALQEKFKIQEGNHGRTQLGDSQKTHL